MFSGKKRAKRGGGAPRGRPRGSRGQPGRIRGQGGHGRGPGRPPLRGAEVLRRGRATNGKLRSNFIVPCHLCELELEDEDEDIITCGCGDKVHSDCYRMDGCD